MGGQNTADSFCSAGLVNNADQPMVIPTNFNVDWCLDCIIACYVIAFRLVLQQ